MFNGRTSFYLQLSKIVVCLLFFLNACSFETTEKAPPFPNNMDWLNRPTQFQINYKKVILLEFMATNCEACIEFLPNLQKVMEKFTDKVEFIGIITAAQDNSVNRLEAINFVQKYKMNYPIIYDRAANLYKTYEINGWPTLILINKNGEIKKRIYGLQSEEYLSQVLQKLIEGEKT